MLLKNFSHVNYLVVISNSVLLLYHSNGKDGTIASQINDLSSLFNSIIPSSGTATDDSNMQEGKCGMVDKCVHNNVFRGRHFWQ